MTPLECVLTAVALTGLWLLVFMSIRAAYYNGVCDGYGYSKEPWNLGYRRAGDYLKATMSHRWPEVK